MQINNTKKQKKQIFVISNNTINTLKKKKKKHNFNKVIYFNYNKNGNYTNICIKFLEKLVLVLMISVLIIDGNNKKIIL